MHDVFFNKLFLAGLVVLGLQWKSQALVEREREGEKRSGNGAKGELNTQRYFPFLSEPLYFQKSQL